MAVRPRGFVPFRHMGGNVSFQTRRYFVSAANPTALFPGDALEIAGLGQVRRLKTSAQSALAIGCLGVVRSIYNVNGRPLTFNQPTAGPFLQASTAGYVDVYDDPGITFIVNSNASVTDNDIGRFVRATAATANSAAGISGMRVDLADVTASAVGHHFQIVGIAPTERIGLVTESGYNASSADLEVRIANHAWTRKNRITGV